LGLSFVYLGAKEGVALDIDPINAVVAGRPNRAFAEKNSFVGYAVNVHARI
jgi:hypothetical protein